VKLGACLQGVSRLFLDTAPVVYYLERHPRYAPVADVVFQRIDSGTVSGVTSPITLAECLVVPIRLGLNDLRTEFASLLAGGANMIFVNLTSTTAEQAADLRARHGLSLADAFQVGAAIEANCDALLTNDMRLKRIRELPILVLEEIEVA
jgi:predicted nucleic acid-binding protein